MATAECGIANGDRKEGTERVDKRLQMVHSQSAHFLKAELNSGFSFLSCPHVTVSPWQENQVLHLNLHPSRETICLLPGCTCKERWELWQNPKFPSSTHSQILVAKELSFSELFFFFLDDCAQGLDQRMGSKMKKEQAVKE